MVPSAGQVVVIQEELPLTRQCYSHEIQSLYGYQRITPIRFPKIEPLSNFTAYQKTNGSYYGAKTDTLLNLSCYM